MKIAIFVLLIGFCFLGSAENKICVYSQILKGQCEALPRCSFYFMETQEKWKTIQGYEGFYEVSNFGNVRSVDRFVFDKGTTKKRLLKGKSMKGSAVKSRCREGDIPYRSSHLRGADKTNAYYIHILVAKAFIPNPDNKPQVNHIDGIKDNNRAENLEWCTQQENMQHASITGLSLKGSKCPYAMTNEDEVKSILIKRRDTGLGSMSIKKKYFPHLTKATLGHIIYGKNWKHVKI